MATRPFAAAKLDLGRMPATRAPYHYALRSESCPDGWVAGPARARRRKSPKPDPTTGLIGPVVPEDDGPVVKFATPDVVAERKAAGVIRMGDMD